MTYQCKHFEITELVPSETLQALGAEKCWWLFDEGGLRTLDLLREALDKPLVINNWNTGGNFSYSGFRPSNCTIGAAYSQHRFGRAFDVKVEGKEDLELSDWARDFIRAHKDQFPWIRAMETGITWVHIDGRNVDQFLEFAS